MPVLPLHSSPALQIVPCFAYQALPVKMTSFRMILHISLQSQALPRIPWTFCSLKWNYSPRLQKPCITTRFYSSGSQHKQSSSSNATALIRLIELADGSKTAGTLMFSRLLCEDFIVLNSSPVLLCVSVNLTMSRKGNLRSTWQQWGCSGLKNWAELSCTKPTKSHVKGRWNLHLRLQPSECSVLFVPTMGDK